MTKVVKFLFVLLLAIPLLSVSQNSMQREIRYKAKSNGIPASPNPIEYTQPDGEVITYHLRGDGAVHWEETTDGFTIIKSNNGYYEYGVKDANDNLIPSGVKISSATSNIPNRTINGVPYSNNKINELKSSYHPETRAEQSRAFPSSGTRNLLLLLVNYPDAANTYNQVDFDNQMNQDNYNGTGSFKQYYFENSYAALTINTTVMGWYTAPNNHDYYGDDNDPTGNRTRELVNNAVDQAEAAGVDFSIFDNDGDGNVDGVMVIHQGIGAEANDGTSIWSHSWSLGGYSVDYDGVTIDAVSLIGMIQSMGQVAKVKL